ncbi:MAG: fibronectin type III domain-containing protein [Campylobacterota bacterium]
MTLLMKTASLAALTLLISGCNLSNLDTPIKPKIDDTIKKVDENSVKTISDITSIAFEWKKVDDPRVVGYNFYRANMHKDGRKLRLIETLDNRYTTHFVDTKLEPNTKYIYQMSAKARNGMESKSTKAKVVKTSPRALPVSFVQGISDLPNRIKIVWRPHPDLRVAYYDVQKLNVKSNKWKTLKTIEGRLNSEYIDTNLGDNKTFKYRVIAYTFEDIETQPSKIVTATTKPLPISVRNLTITKDKPKKIVLNWDPSPTEDILKYVIYRSPFENIGFSKHKEFSKNSLDFTDHIDEDGKIYYYKVYSIDEDYLRSADVDSKMGKTLDKPAKPNMTLAQIQGDKAILNWIAGDNRAVSYNIYKTTKTGFWESKTEKFTDIKELRFEDHNIINGVQYKYSIQANDEYGLMSKKTDEAELILPKVNKKQ